MKKTLLVIKKLTDQLTNFLIDMAILESQVLSASKNMLAPHRGNWTHPEAEY